MLSSERRHKLDSLRLDSEKNMNMLVMWSLELHRTPLNTNLYNKTCNISNRTVHKYHQWIRTGRYIHLRQAIMLLELGNINNFSFKCCPYDLFNYTWRLRSLFHEIKNGFRLDCRYMYYIVITKLILTRKGFVYVIGVLQQQ